MTLRARIVLPSEAVMVCLYWSEEEEEEEEEEGEEVIETTGVCE